VFNIKALFTYDYGMEKMNKIKNLGYNVIFKNEKGITVTDDIKDIDILVCYNPFETLDISNMNNLKWIQLSSIGVKKMIRNAMKLEIPSKSQNESFARVVVASFASQLDPTIEELADVKTAVSEAVTNAIIHGYENEIGIIVIECSIIGNKLEIEVIDKGKGIRDIQLAMEPLFTSKPDLERSGMGFTVMETFMDKLEVLSIEGEGTKIKMVKEFKSVSTEG